MIRVVVDELLLLLLLLFPVPQGRARLALGLESDAALARLVVVSFAAELLRVTSIAGLADHRLGHGHGPRPAVRGEGRVGKTWEKVFKKSRTPNDPPHGLKNDAISWSSETGNVISFPPSNSVGQHLFLLSSLRGRGSLMHGLA
jgi:hypothetical protein